MSATVSDGKFVASAPAILDYRHEGLLRAAIIVGMWAISIVAALVWFPLREPWAWFAPVVVAWIMFLYTGLFITAHDAMHGSLMPKDPRWNDRIGRMCVFIFALFSYAKLVEKHREHHAQPATPADPDFHDGRRSAFWAWYAHFLMEYVTWRQLVGMGVVFCTLWLAIGLRAENVLLFWAAPAILSTLQLFYFGTYRPHRETDGGYADRHHSTTSGWPRWLSLVTCYHFGYHWEHHEYPYIPWWKLGRLRATLPCPSHSGRKSG